MRFSHDLRYGLRMLRKTPGLTAILVFTLGLGVGANTAIFSIINAVLLRPLPYRDSSRLIVIWDRDLHAKGISKMFDSYRDFQQIARNARTLDQAAAATWAINGKIFSGTGPARELLAMPVSESFFSLLGVPPARGRTFVPEDLQRGCSVVLGDRFWRGPLNHDPDVVGKSIRLDDRSCNVLGVMPPGFAFYPEAAQLWVLLTPDFVPPPDNIPVGVFARVKPGVSQAQAQAEVTAIHAALHRSDGKERDIEPVVYDLQGEFTFLAEADLRATLLVLLAAVAFVLVIACVNVANILLGRAVVRERELAVRAALGCGRGRLMRQLLTEGLLLAFLGGAVGVGVGFVAIRYFRAVNPIEMPVGANVELSWPVLAFTVGIASLTVLLFGVIPAWKASQVDLIDSLRAAGRGSLPGVPLRLTKALVSAEMALSLVLLTGAGLLMQSVLRMGAEPLGFRAQGLTVTAVTLPADRYPDAARRMDFYNRLAWELGGNAALATSLPPYGLGPNAELHIEGQNAPPEERRAVGQQTVNPEYFRMMEIPLLRGRQFDERDRASLESVAIVNEALAREYFPHGDVIGRRICVGDPGATNPWRTIVGVVASDKRSPNYRQIGWVERAAVLKPMAQDPPRSLAIVMRGAGRDIQGAISKIDNAVAVGDTETMQTRLARFLQYPRFRAVLLGGFAAFAVLLAAVGLYGVLGQFVALRKQEIGVRMAVGARTPDVLWLIAIQGGVPVLIGLAAGLAGALALSRYLSGLLYGVSAKDPVTFLVVAVVLVCTAAVAALIPAARASRIDPMVALRHE